MALPDLRASLRRNIHSIAFLNIKGCIEFRHALKQAVNTNSAHRMNICLIMRINGTAYNGIESLSDISKEFLIIKIRDLFCQFHDNLAASAVSAGLGNNNASVSRLARHHLYALV